MNMLPLIAQAKNNTDKVAIYSDDTSYTFNDLLIQSHLLASSLLEQTNDLKEARVAFMVNPGFKYVQALWGIWQAGGVAVPLCITHPFPSLSYVLEDTGASVLIISKEYETLLSPFIEKSNCKTIVIDSFLANQLQSLPEIELSRKALILYTSGTTNKPKGVVTTHANIQAQVTTLVSAWEW